MDTGILEASPGAITVGQVTAATDIMQGALLTRPTKALISPQSKLDQGMAEKILERVGNNIEPDIGEAIAALAQHIERLEASVGFDHGLFQRKTTQ
jgi:hypothetical protein